MESKTNEYQLDKLKNDFRNIQLVIEEINKSKNIIFDKIGQFKSLYQDLIKTNNTKIFIFCLDSLYFQYKLSLMDYESIKQNFAFIMNRMYCDYYKLYNIIISEMTEKKVIEIKKKTFPVYKDLDVLYEYKFETTINIHNDILSVIDRLYSKYNESTFGIENYVETKKSVVSISNFLNTLKYENGLLENQIMLYINYISFFHFSQKKILVRLYSKMVELNKNIDEYLNVNNVISIDDIHSVASDTASALSVSITDSVLMNTIKDKRSSPKSDITENDSVCDIEEKAVEEGVEPLVKPVVNSVVEEGVEPLVKPVVNSVVEEGVEPVIILESPIDYSLIKLAELDKATGHFLIEPEEEPDQINNEIVEILNESINKIINDEIESNNITI